MLERGENQLPAGERRLAAIVFTDIAGYTALGQRNESISLAMLDEYRKLLRPLFSRHRGKEIKTIGDAFLVEFPSAIDALRCGYDIQRSSREFNIALAGDERLRLRVGIHLGDVLESAGDILGDAVNVASRIEPLAEDGGVCLTRQVYDQVKNKFELPFVSLGQKVLKNVDSPFEVFRVVMPWERGQGVEGQPMKLDRRRVAILPFSNISPDPNDMYIADGMTEELISTMSKISGLSVLARTSVMRYKGGERNIEEIAKELKAGTVLEGSVRKAGDKVRVTVQVIDSESSVHLWSESYDREMKDVFAIQADISQTVASALKVKLLVEEKARIQAEPTRSTEAHALFLKGIYYSMNEYTSESGSMNSIRCFERALELDPNYALAHAWLSDSYSGLAAWGFWPLEKARPLAEKAASKALELDPRLAEAHRSIAFLKYLERDWKASETEMNKAIDLNPNDAWNHAYRAAILSDLGRIEEAVVDAKAALELAPLDRFANQVMGNLLYQQRKYEDAIDLIKRARELDPGFALFSRLLGLCYLQLSRYDEAIEQLRAGIEPSQPWRGQSILAVAFARSGRVEEATKILDDLEVARRSNGVPAYAIAQIQLALGRRDEAIGVLKEAYEHREYESLDEMRVSQLFDDLRSDPRFVAITQKPAS